MQTPSPAETYTFCEELGGHLATITSEEEQTFVESYMNANSYSARTWIGAYSDGEKWQWVTDEEFEYINWTGSDPNNYGGVQFFGSLNYYDLGGWTDDEPFIYDHYILCEWEAE